jgi:hypothetical protein
MRRSDEVDPVKGLSMIPDEFLAQQARREKVFRMQDAVRPGRTIPVSVRFDQFTLSRLRTLGAMHNKG